MSSVRGGSNLSSVFEVLGILVCVFPCIHDSGVRIIVQMAQISLQPAEPLLASFGTVSCLLRSGIKLIHTWGSLTEDQRMGSPYLSFLNSGILPRLCVLHKYLPFGSSPEKQVYLRTCLLRSCGFLITSQLGSTLQSYCPRGKTGKLVTVQDHFSNLSLSSVICLFLRVLG